MADANNISFVAMNSNPQCTHLNLRYFWHFGDSKTVYSTGATATTSHNYSLSGQYIVTLKILMLSPNDSLI